MTKSNIFTFYKNQIEHFNRSLDEVDSLFEELANNDSLTNDEYAELYELAVNTFRM